MKLKISHFIWTVLLGIIMVFCPLTAKANDCEDFSGYMEGGWFVVEGVGDGSFTKIHPWWSGNIPCTEDVYNVQCAVMNHNKVMLKNSFDFGDIKMDPAWSFRNLQTGAVSVHMTVEIVGDNATIYNGRHVFAVIGKSGTPANPNGSQDISIKNIKFVNAKEVVFSVHGDCKSYIVDNVFIDGIRVINHPEWGNYSFKHGISSHGEYMFPWQSYDVFKIGKISLTNSHINLGNYYNDPIDEEGTPVGTQHGRAAFLWGIGTPEDPTEIIIRNNEIYNISNVAFICSALAGRITIKYNIIKTGDFAAPGPSPFNPIGIFADQTGTPLWIWPDGTERHYEEGMVKLKIEENEFECGSIDSDEIMPLGLWINEMSGAIIKKNIITVHSGFGESGLGHILVDWGINDRMKILKNKLIGPGNVKFAISLGSTVNSVIRGNDLTELTALDAPLWMWPGANNNIVLRNYIGQGGQFGGLYCDGAENKLVLLTFEGDYQGWPEEPDDWSETGFIALGENSHDNFVIGLKDTTPPFLFDICGQVRDLGTNNHVPGLNICKWLP